MKLFGRSYETVGKSDADFCIKTRGQVKVQWGSKFIDLIKDGKVNADVKFIYQQDEVGSKDGIYVSKDCSTVSLVIGGQAINLTGEAGTTYVSFLEGQKTTAEQKYNALVNIGFIYSDLSSMDSTSLQNGIVYVESEQSLYIIKDGQASKYSVSLPNPFTEQIVITKTGSSVEGALVINGEGTENAVILDDFYIYKQDGQLIVSASNQRLYTLANKQATFNIPICTNTVQSLGATAKSGFRLYNTNGKSTLEVDNLIVRDSSETSESIEFVHPTQWYSSNNIIKSADYAASSTEEDEQYTLTLQDIVTYKTDDYLYIYYADKVTITYIDGDGDTIEDTVNQLVKLPIQVVSADVSTNTITIKAYGNATLPEPEDLVGKTTFLIGNSSKLTIMRQSDNALDLFQSTSFEDEQDTSKIHTRIGDLTELALKGKEDEAEVEIEDKLGVYSQNIVAKTAQYTSDYDLPADDKSTKFASTEWVQNLGAASSAVPVGAIIMYSGETIPEGWAICDGTNGTPNLTGKIIQANTTAGQTGNITASTEESELKYYSLVFIMKIS